MQAFLFLTALAAASAVDCRKRTIPDFLCLLTAAAGLISFSPAQFFGVLAARPLRSAARIRPVLYFCTAMLFQKFIHHPLPAMTRAALPLGPFLSIGFAALYCFGG